MTAIGALAHSGATGVVKVRMDAMAQIRDGMKILGTMASGKIAFDADLAANAAAQIKTHASDIPALFKKKDTSAPSEARAEIWSNWQDFVRKAEALTKAADFAAKNSGSLKGVRKFVRKLGQACKDCHQDYRL